MQTETTTLTSRKTNGTMLRHVVGLVSTSTTTARHRHTMAGSQDAAVAEQARHEKRHHREEAPLATRATLAFVTCAVVMATRWAVGAGVWVIIVVFFRHAVVEHTLSTTHARHPLDAALRRIGSFRTCAAPVVALAKPLLTVLAAHARLQMQLVRVGRAQKSVLRRVTVGNGRN